jgi:hypothetical protein
MEKTKTYENFPLWMIAIYDTVSFGIYILGLYIMFKFGAILGWLYFFFCLCCEIRIMRTGCIHCYYYGKWCGAGRSKLAALLFKKGDPRKFLEKEITWKALIPDMLISLIPFVMGIYLLFTGFNWYILLAVILLFLLTTQGNAFVHGNIVCKYCKQRKLGCPAEKLFTKTK